MFITEKTGFVRLWNKLISADFGIRLTISAS